MATSSDVLLRDATPAESIGMNLEECLPPDLRGAETKIAPIAMGFSGAAVHRVDAGGRAFVLKLARADETDVDWRRALQVQQTAAAAGLTPAIVHVDESRRAVLTTLVVDRVFPARYLDPRTHAAAVGELGRTGRRIHALPIPAGASPRDPRQLLVHLWSELRAGFAIPELGREVIEEAIAAAPPPGGAPVLGHNDLNPSNLLYDGASLLVLDWSTAGPADAFVDLATLAVFLRMDDATCLGLLAAYDEAPPRDRLPERFLYTRRLVAAVVGTMMLHLARRRGHAGAAAGETLAAALSLGPFYQEMRAGTVNPATPDGQWAFGKALLKASRRQGESP
jgi:aminoglycoside phosphotransferase (APT) family kinase protein